MHKDAVFEGPMKEKMNVRIIFIEEILGSCPNSAEVYDDFVAHLASDQDRQDEIAALGADQVVENDTTKFLMVDGRPALSNHTWLGFLKEKVGFIKLDDSGTKKTTASGKLSNYKKRFDNGVTFANKFSILVLPKGEETGKNQRPLRAQTPKGERIALASSITCPARTRTRFTILMTNPEYKKAMIEALDLGRYAGTGQWRGSGKKGRFLWEEFDDEGNIVGGNTKEAVGATTKDPDFNEKLISFIESEAVGQIEEDFE